jgi:hypothetical protein
MAGDGTPEAKLALPLEVQALLVEAGADNHRAVEVAQLVIGDGMPPLGFGRQHAVIVEQGSDGFGRLRVGRTARIEHLCHTHHS